MNQRVATIEKGIVSDFNSNISTAETFRQISGSVSNEQALQITRALLSQRTNPKTLYIRVANSATTEGETQAFKLGDPDNFSGVSNGSNIAFTTNFKPGYAKLLEYLKNRKIVTVGFQCYVSAESVYDTLAPVQYNRDFDKIANYDLSTDFRNARTKRTNDEPKIRNLDVALILSDDFALAGVLGSGASIEFTFDVRGIVNY